MRRFAILMSPLGYEMSVALADDSEAAKTAAGKLDDESVQSYVVMMMTWELEREIDYKPSESYYSSRGRDSNTVDRRVKAYKTRMLNSGAKATGNEIDMGSQMAYYIRKNHAQVLGQKEFCFALNQEDMDWIYRRDPVSAGLILCQLFDGTKSNEFVNKEIEDPRTGKPRMIMGYNKNTEKKWGDDLKYDMEDFHDEYKAKLRSIKRRENRK